MRSPKILAATTLLAALALVIGASVFTVGIQAQQKAEICDNGIDDDGDKAIDCKDTDCAEACKPGTGCSPGFYKNHPEIWVGLGCGDDQALMTALTCKGSDASCGRSAAAAVLDACTGCSE